MAENYSQALCQWQGRPYYSLNQHLKETFGEKIYKIALNGGFTCPNRDGTLDSRGCIFCSAGGSGDFAGDRFLTAAAKADITAQLNAGRALLCQKNNGSRFIAYFQAFTNTYAPAETLRHRYSEAMNHPQVSALSIATRPDCLPDETIELLREISRIKPVWIELGLQTIHEDTARQIRRGYSLNTFTTAVKKLQAAGITTIVHTILGLPGESPEDMLETHRFLAEQPIQGIKLQLLHILKNTDLAALYAKEGFQTLTLEAYADLVIRCIEVLPPDMVIHRITGDGPKELLIAPLWSGHKKLVLNTIHHEFKKRGTWQGRLFQSSSSTAKKGNFQ